MTPEGPSLRHEYSDAPAKRRRRGSRASTRIPRPGGSGRDGPAPRAPDLFGARGIEALPGRRIRAGRGAVDCGVARIRVGTSGWVYRHWRGVLYPEGLAPRAWLSRYASLFDTVELNATFYRLPTPEAVERWRDAVPPAFTFAVKGSRFLTHLKRLLDADEGLRRFHATVGRLGAKLGPVLLQLPPRLKPDLERLDRFLSRVPAGRNNDLGGHAVRDALDLLALLGEDRPALGAPP